MSASQYLSSGTSEQLPRSAFESIDIPRIYNELGLDYERYVLDDEGRAKTIQWVISKLSAQQSAPGHGFYVVDLGCAGGRPTVETIAHALRDIRDQRKEAVTGDTDNVAPCDHVVMGVDLSPVQLAHARERISTVNSIAQFDLGDMRTWSPAAPYCDDGVDAVLSHYAINHLPLDDYRMVIQRMVSWLRPGGILALGTIAHVNGLVKWFGYDVAGTSMPLNETVALVEELGCKVEQSWEEEWKSATNGTARGKVNQFILAVKA